MQNRIQKPPHRKAFDWRPLIGIVLIWFLSAYIYASYIQRQQPVQKIAYSAFKHAVEQDRVDRVTFRGQRILGAFKAEKGQTSDQEAGDRDQAAEAPGSSQRPTGARFSTYLPQVRDPELLPLLEHRKVTIFAENL